ncbi:MAG: hypothetical protein JO161_10930, partial [Planctomycetaceae bacterium]|nr:hypothetical protein [Planctomycetaceae bacterium]
EELQASSTSPAAEPEAAGSSLVGKALEDIERYYITQTLKLTGGNREEAAQLLGIGERTLYRKLKEYAGG